MNFKKLLAAVILVTIGPGVATVLVLSGWFPYFLASVGTGLCIFALVVLVIWSVKELSKP